MGIPLRVLIVEDSVDDTELVLRQLRRAGYDPVSERVETAEQMKTALEREPWDLVVSDYSMPQFDAPTALNLLNQGGRDIPFIVVSGSIGEDIAVTMMKTGAHDYLLKQNLTRFVPAIQRELREAENRRQQRLTEQTKQRLQIERGGLLERLKQENEDLAALTQVTANAISTLELEELLRVLLGRIVEVMHADAVTILLADGGELRVRASVGTVDLSASTHVVRVGEGFAGSIAACLKPVFIADAQQDPLVQDPLIRERGIRSMLGVPLKRNGVLIGVLHVDWLTVRPCREREVHLLEITAERCAAAIQNAQLYQEAKRIAAALTASEARYRTLAESAQDIIYVINREFRVEYVNEYGASQFGRSTLEITGRHLTELFPPETTQWQLADMAGVFRTGESLHRERQLPAGPRLVWLDTRLVPIKNATGEVESILGISRDITASKEVQGQMLRTQRLESIGTLAGGVAHDLNNALAPIMMATELLRLEFPDTASRYLELIEAGAKRGAEMVKQLLTFAKGAEGERLLIQPRHLLREMEKLIQGTFPKNIRFQLSCAKDLRTILGDTTHLHQVLLNLCVNARDAMPEGGTLTLKAENIEMDAVAACGVPEAKPGPYVVWRVMDTGAGISPEIQDRIFEPFFTTKGPEKGTGLGLSTVLGLVKGHGGFVRVNSVPGQGSTFAVYLPAYGADAGDIARLTHTETAFRGQGETILVVDDEADVREIMRTVLTNLNFKVLTAANGTEAVVQVGEKRGELRAVITDLHMPGMDGLTFVRVLKGRLPQAAIIVVSGRLDDREAQEFKTLGVNALIEKPFTQDTLVEALKTVFQK